MIESSFIVFSHSYLLVNLIYHITSHMRFSFLRRYFHFFPHSLFHGVAVVGNFLCVCRQPFVRKINWYGSKSVLKVMAKYRRGEKKKSFVEIPSWCISNGYGLDNEWEMNQSPSVWHVEEKNGEWHRGKFGASFHINFLKQKTASSIREHFSMASMAKCLVLSWDFVSSEMVWDGIGWDGMGWDRVWIS